MTGHHGNRRVVVTGIGLVSSLGIGTEANWAALMAGQSGIATITKFDATQFATQHRGRSEGLRPAASSSRRKTSRRWTSSSSTRSPRRSSRWTMPALTITPENAPRVGVFIASGIGGFTTIEREHKALLEGGPRKISPFFIPSAIINLAAGQVSIRFGAKGPELGDLHGLLGVGARDRRRVRDHPARRGRRDDRRRIGGGDHADGRSAASARCARCRRATTSPRSASRPFDKDRDGFIVGEGVGRADPRGVRARHGARRADLRRARRLRHVGRRVPHHRAVRGRRRRVPRDERGDRKRRHRARQVSTTSTRTAPRRRTATRSRRSRSSAASATTRRSWRCRRPSR